MDSTTWNMYIELMLHFSYENWPENPFEDNLMIDVISHVSPLNAHCI